MVILPLVVGWVVQENDRQAGLPGLAGGGAWGRAITSQLIATSCQTQWGRLHSGTVKGRAKVNSHTPAILSPEVIKCVLRMARF